VCRWLARKKRPCAPVCPLAQCPTRESGSVSLHYVWGLLGCVGGQGRTSRGVRECGWCVCTLQQHHSTCAHLDACTRTHSATCLLSKPSLTPRVYCAAFFLCGQVLAIARSRTTPRLTTNSSCTCAADLTLHECARVRKFCGGGVYPTNDRKTPHGSSNTLVELAGKALSKMAEGEEEGERRGGRRMVYSKQLQ
jgi:hypothetical protein